MMGNYYSFGLHNINVHRCNMYYGRHLLFVRKVSSTINHNEWQKEKKTRKKYKNVNACNVIRPIPFYGN